MQPNSTFGRLPARLEREGCSRLACSCGEHHRFGAFAQNGLGRGLGPGLPVPVAGLGGSFLDPAATAWQLAANAGPQPNRFELRSQFVYRKTPNGAVAGSGALSAMPAQGHLAHGTVHCAQVWSVTGH